MFARKYFDDIFGKKVGSVICEGLVDTPYIPDFNEKLEVLEAKRKKHDSEVVKN